MLEDALQILADPSSALVRRELQVQADVWQEGGED